MYIEFLAPLPFYQKIAVGAMSGKELTIESVNNTYLLIVSVNKLKATLGS